MLARCQALVEIRPRQLTKSAAPDVLECASARKPDDASQRGMSGPNVGASATWRVGSAIVRMYSRPSVVLLESPREADSRRRVSAEKVLF